MTKRTAKLLMTNALKYARREAAEYRRVRISGDAFNAAMALRFVREWIKEAKKYKEVIG